MKTQQTIVSRKHHTKIFLPSIDTERKFDSFLLNNNPKGIWWESLPAHVKKHYYAFSDNVNLHPSILEWLKENECTFEVVDSMWDVDEENVKYFN